MNKLNKIIIISGSSGAGKTTLVNHLMSYPQFNLVFSVSACSRAKRPLEINGAHYFFISANEFKDKIKTDQFLEWEEVYDDHFYGTLKSTTMEILDEGKNILFDVDVKGARSIKNYFKEQALSIFIKAPTLKIARKRLMQRKTDSENSVDFRVKKIEQETLIGEQMDHQLINDDLTKSKHKIKELVREFLDL
tara:strand:- start:696 stop:1271 length:576 start_codon:yes stop_codon:yes gene_type:complete